MDKEKRVDHSIFCQGCCEQVGIGDEGTFALCSDCVEALQKSLELLPGYLKEFATSH